jgi:predicted transcriptional regulator YheO
LHFLVFTQRDWKLMFTQNVHMDVYNSFIIHMRQKLEATKMSFSRWMNTLTVIQQDNWILLSAKKSPKYQSMISHGRNFKCISINERSQSAKAIYCIIPNIDILEKTKLMDQWLPGVEERKLEWVGRAQSILRQ